MPARNCLVRVTISGGNVRILARKSPAKWKRQVMRQHRHAAFGKEPLIITSQLHLVGQHWDLLNWQQLHELLASEVREATHPDFAADYMSRAEKEHTFEVLTANMTELETRMKNMLGAQ